MVELEDLQDDLRFEFPEVPERTLTSCLRRSAINMCREGDLARRIVVVDTTPGVENYRLELHGDVEIASLMGVRDLEDGRPVRIRIGIDPWPSALVCAWLEPPDELRYRNSTRRRKRLEVNLSVSPTLEAHAIDRDLADRHYEVLLAGARSLMYAVANKPWSSPELASIHGQAQMDGIFAAKGSELVRRQKGFWLNRNSRVL